MLWHKGTEAEDWVTRFTVGEDYKWDQLLIPYDIDGTEVHAWALNEIGILTDKEYGQIQETLEQLRQNLADGEVEVTPEDEDCHTVIETYLTNELGDTGQKIHAGRSRNDQVLVALRLFLRAHLQQIGQQTIRVAEHLCDHGEKYDDLVMPGYTHLQRAMPTTAGGWALGFGELLAEDLQRLEGAYRMVNTSPWGSAAGYGVPHLKLPRAEVAERLGFARTHIHPSSVQLTRGKLEQQVTHALLQVAESINRLASDLVLYNSQEFGFVNLPEEYSTGSSIMPQKKNPDILELARATYHRILGKYQTLLTLPANLPSGYHRDLQLTKAATMESMLVAEDLLTTMDHFLPHLTFDREKVAESLTPELWATSNALERVVKGVPFRQAYRDAAAEVNELQVPETSAALKTYRVRGYPGQGDPTSIRRTLRNHSWCLPSK